MKTILFINQNSVQAIYIHKKETQYSNVALRPGTVLNGVILDAEQLENALQSLNLQGQKITLVMDSSNILSKNLTLPKVSQNKLYQMVKSEFDLFHTEHNYLYDVNVLSTDTSITAMGYAVTQDMVAPYIQVCKNCGIVVVRVEFVLNGLINYITKKPELQGKTFLFNVISGEHLLSLFFENGTYKLSNRIRLLHVGEGVPFYQELYSRLSAMTQFGSSERFTNTITDSYYIGISEDDIHNLAQFVDGILSVNVQSYQDFNWDMDYFLPALATYKNKQDINFAINRQQNAERTQKNRSLSLKFAVFALVLGIVGGHSWSILQNYHAACADYDQAQAIVTKEETLSALRHFSDLQVEDTQVIADLSEYEALSALLDSGAVVEKQVLEQVFQDGVIKNFSFDFTTGAVRINGAFPTNAAATDYAAKLRSQGFFVTMDYEGYLLEEVNQNSETPIKEYHFTITAAYPPVDDIYSEEVASK